MSENKRSIKYEKLHPNLFPIIEPKFFTRNGFLGSKQSGECTPITVINILILNKTTKASHITVH